MERERERERRVAHYIRTAVAAKREAVRTGRPPPVVWMDAEIMRDFVGDVLPETIGALPTTLCGLKVHSVSGLEMQLDVGKRVTVFKVL